VIFKVYLLKTVKITSFCHQKRKNSTLIDKNLRTASFHPILMFYTILESGDKANENG
jgi:hypothetical protein